MSWLRKGLVFLLTMAAPTAAVAAEVDARAVTLLGGRPDARDGVIYTVVPMYELVSLNARQLDLSVVENMQVVVSLWGRLDPADPADGDLADGDIDLGYVEGGFGKGALKLRLGRQLVFTGAARNEGLDGLRAEGRLGPAALTLYGGVPVTPRFGVDRGDALWGARASLRRSVDAEIGLSYAQALDDGRLRRLDLGVDGRYATRRLTVTALALVSAAEWRLAEARAAATLQILPTLHLYADLGRTAPDLFLSRASILSVFSEEHRDEGGAVVSWRARRDIRLRGGYHALGNEEGLGHRAEAAADVDVARSVLLGAETGFLILPEDGYLHGRLFGRAEVAPKMMVTLDGDLYRLEEERNGTRLSSRATASWRWDPAPRWRAVVSGLVGSDPLYEIRWEAMLKVAWNFEARGQRGQR